MSSGDSVARIMAENYLINRLLLDIPVILHVFQVPASCLAMHQPRQAPVPYYLRTKSAAGWTSSPLLGMKWRPSGVGGRDQPRINTYPQETHGRDS